MTDTDERKRERGSSMVYAVEGVVFGVIGMAWLQVRDALFAPSVLDTVCATYLLCASLVNLLLCSVLEPGRMQAAFFGLNAGVLTLYAYLVAATLIIGGTGVDTLASLLNQTVLNQTETTEGGACVANARGGAGALVDLLFGNLTLYQIPAGVTLGLLTMVTLLSGAGGRRYIWDGEEGVMWEGFAVLLVTGVHLVVARNERMSPAQPEASWVLALSGAWYVLLLLCEVLLQEALLPWIETVFPRVDLWLARLIVRLLWVMYMVGIGAGAGVMAWRNGLYSWALPVAVGACLFVTAIRLAQDAKRVWEERRKEELGDTGEDAETHEEPPAKPVPKRAAARGSESSDNMRRLLRMARGSIVIPSATGYAPVPTREPKYEVIFGPKGRPGQQRAGKGAKEV